MVSGGLGGVCSATLSADRGVASATLSERTASVEARGVASEAAEAGGGGGVGGGNGGRDAGLLGR